MSEVNSMWFDNIGEVLDLVDYLLKTNDRHYNDIRIHPDDANAYVVEWAQHPWSNDWGGNFKYVDENQVVMKEYSLPDNSTVLLLDDNEFNEYLDNWLKENPGWRKTSYGTWTNEIENEEFLKLIE